jgi:hypothetical protein
MSDTISISVSTAAIFSAELGCGRPPPKRKDMLKRVVGRSSIEVKEDVDFVGDGR